MQVATVLVKNNGTSTLPQRVFRYVSGKVRPEVQILLYALNGVPLAEAQRLQNLFPGQVALARAGDQLSMKKSVISLVGVAPQTVVQTVTRVEREVDTSAVNSLRAQLSQVTEDLRREQAKNSQLAADNAKLTADKTKLEDGLILLDLQLADVKQKLAAAVKSFSPEDSARTGCDDLPAVLTEVEKITSLSGTPGDLAGAVSKLRNVVVAARRATKSPGDSTLDELTHELSDQASEEKTALLEESGAPDLRKLLDIVREVNRAAATPGHLGGVPRLIRNACRATAAEGSSLEEVTVGFHKLLKKTNAKTLAEAEDKFERLGAKAREAEEIEGVFRKVRWMLGDPGLSPDEVVAKLYGLSDGGKLGDLKTKVEELGKKVGNVKTLEEVTKGVGDLVDESGTGTLKELLEVVRRLNGLAYTPGNLGEVARLLQTVLARKKAASLQELAAKEDDSVVSSSAPTVSPDSERLKELEGFFQKVRWMLGDPGLSPDEVVAKLYGLSDGRKLGDLKSKVEELGNKVGDVKTLEEVTKGVGDLVDESGTGTLKELLEVVRRLNGLAYTPGNLGEVARLLQTVLARKKAASLQELAAKEDDSVVSSSAPTVSPDSERLKELEGFFQKVRWMLGDPGLSPDEVVTKLYGLSDGGKLGDLTRQVEELGEKVGNVKTLEEATKRVGDLVDESGTGTLKELLEVVHRLNGLAYTPGNLGEVARLLQTVFARKKAASLQELAAKEDDSVVSSSAPTVSPDSEKLKELEGFLRKVRWLLGDPGLSPDEVVAKLYGLSDGGKLGDLKTKVEELGKKVGDVKTLEEVTKEVGDLVDESGTGTLKELLEVVRRLNGLAYTPGNLGEVTRLIQTVLARKKAASLQELAAKDDSVVFLPPTVSLDSEKLKELEGFLRKVRWLLGDPGLSPNEVVATILKKLGEAGSTRQVDELKKKVGINSLEEATKRVGDLVDESGTGTLMELLEVVRRLNGLAYTPGNLGEVTRLLQTVLARKKAASLQELAAKADDPSPPTVSPDSDKLKELEGFFQKVRWMLGDRGLSPDEVVAKLYGLSDGGKLGDLKSKVEELGKKVGGVKTLEEATKRVGDLVDESGTGSLKELLEVVRRLNGLAYTPGNLGEVTRLLQTVIARKKAASLQEVVAKADDVVASLVAPSPPPPTPPLVSPTYDSHKLEELEAFLRKVRWLMGSDKTQDEIVATLSKLKESAGVEVSSLPEVVKKLRGGHQNFDEVADAFTELRRLKQVVEHDPSPVTADDVKNLTRVLKNLQRYGSLEETTSVVSKLADIFLGKNGQLQLTKKFTEWPDHLSDVMKRNEELSEREKRITSKLTQGLFG